VTRKLFSSKTITQLNELGVQIMDYEGRIRKVADIIDDLVNNVYHKHNSTVTYYTALLMACHDITEYTRECPINFCKYESCAAEGFRERATFCWFNYYIEKATDRKIEEGKQ
jgi:hypothetical protein